MKYMVFGIVIGLMTLIEFTSSLLKDGYTRVDVYNAFLHYLSTHECNDELEDEVISTLDILSGYHNPYIIVNENGILFKKDLN